MPAQMRCQCTGGAEGVTTVTVLAGLEPPVAGRPMGTTVASSPLSRRGKSAFSAAMASLADRVGLDERRVQQESSPSQRQSVSGVCSQDSRDAGTM